MPQRGEHEHGTFLIHEQLLHGFVLNVLLYIVLISIRYKFDCVADHQFLSPVKALRSISAFMGTGL